MEASPLTRQPQPEVFTPKIISLYETLFKEDDISEKSEGFWREFFLHRQDRAALRSILNEIPPDEILVLESRTRELFARAVETLKHGRGSSPANALDTLSVFLSSVLGKRYPHPSSDIISVLAGLDQVDTVFTDCVGALDGLIRNGQTLEVRHKAVEVLLATTAGAYQTTLLTYMIQRDLFPSIIKFIQDSDMPGQILEPFTLIGLLSNYNKFEFRNPYQMRLSDFVNESTIQKIIRCIGYTCQVVRAEYVDVQDDLPEGWTLSRTLNMIGLGFIIPGPKPEKKPVYDAETTKQMFTKLPGDNAAILLSTYDFAHANKLFCANLVAVPAVEGEEQPFASYLSLTSYFLQHAHLSQRASDYAHMNLMVLRQLIEDPAICKRICAEGSATPVRLCRHRQPYLPLVKGDRVLAACLLDVMVDAINHNLRKRLDVRMYTLCVGILLRVTSHLSRSRTRLKYHWPELFRSLLSLIRFLSQYNADLKDLPRIDTLLDHVVNLVALSLSAGEAFLPTPAAYDDLFYKVVESGETLTKFKENYRLSNRHTNSIDTLINVSAHYKQMLAEGKKRPSNLTPQQVTEVIKQGYETLSIQAKEGLDSWEKFREADERIVLKTMARSTVSDARAMVER
ncbi:unnamed protein product [Clonostachys rosea f. rosea IK726]|uniref:Armadillo-like helical domain-containing protein n=2 Tax=Bionectria ochroleuca TaxID=29856 RepID=A0A0B7KIS1_BIOOC|nr:unnamed protein product [Clonostachys rosea f. rosea IK726]